MNALETIAASIVGNALVLAVLGWLAKSLIEKVLQRDSKRFELELTSASNVAIEKLKSDLAQRANEHQIRFSRLHERQASVIAELNGLMVEALWEAENFLSPLQWQGEPTKEEKHRVAMQKLVDLYRYFDKHRIYLPEALCKHVDSFIDEVRSHVVKFGVYLDVDQQNASKEVLKERHDAWFGGWKAIKEQTPAVRSELESKFRELLGGGA